MTRKHVSVKDKLIFATRNRATDALRDRFKKKFLMNDVPESERAREKMHTILFAQVHSRLIHKNMGHITSQWLYSQRDF
jgi:hypothetical protein